MSFYICTESQRFCIDMDHLLWIFSGGSGCIDCHAAAGISLYCRRYAAGARRAGDHGSDVPECIWGYFHGRISDAVIVCDERDQFLFRVIGQSGRGGSEQPVCAA